MHAARRDLMKFCAEPPLKPAQQHIGTVPQPGSPDIPPPVAAPALPPATGRQGLETYSVVVNEVPVRELLFRPCSRCA